MNVRLIILVVVAGGMAVFLATNRSKQPATMAIDAPAEADVVSQEVRDKSKVPSEIPLPGSEPDDPPVVPDDFAVTVEVDTSKGKNRLYFNITEKHGYYVETFRLTAWFKRPGVEEPEDSPLQVPVYLPEYLKANETLRTCIEVVPAELRRVGGSIGKSEDWEARIDYYHRAREKNPETFPPTLRVQPCD